MTLGRRPASGFFTVVDGYSHHESPSKGKSPNSADISKSDSEQSEQAFRNEGETCRPAAASIWIIMNIHALLMAGYATDYSRVVDSWINEAAKNPN